MNYWLMKTEPSTFSIDDLMARPRQTEAWDGVRNYQARNMMRDDMQKGDQVLFYHSNCQPPGIVGIAEIVREAYQDPTAFDPKSPYYDHKSVPEKPRWVMVDVKFKQKFPHMLSLDELRQVPALNSMLLLRKGNRLSITPVTATEWKTILQLVK
ncbi:MAG: EVE domain-containing protein [Legionellales bacterium]|nr:EVE domain-containing protein [Legionellales bacterium]